MTPCEDTRGPVFMNGKKQKKLNFVVNCYKI